MLDGSWCTYQPETPCLTDRCFWTLVDRLVASSEVTIDRPRGSRHPRFPDFIYPLDYGYLEGTRAGDGGGIDVWCGSLPERLVMAAIVTIDLEKRDAEVKLLLGCTPEEIEIVLRAHQAGMQAAVIVPRRSDPTPPS